MRQYLLTDPGDCQWLRETHLKPANLNNAVPFDFNCAHLLGNEDCPSEIWIYRNAYPQVGDFPARAMLMDNGKYSFLP